MWKGIPHVRNNSKLEITIIFSCLALSGSLCGTLLNAVCVIGSRSSVLMKLTWRREGGFGAGLGGGEGLEGEGLEVENENGLFFCLSL
jgi:hypothetical protein